MYQKNDDEYKALEEMFESLGWQIFMQEVTEHLEMAKNTAYLLNTETELHTRKGSIQTLSWVSNYEMLNKEIEESFSEGEWGAED